MPTMDLLYNPIMINSYAFVFYGAEWFGSQTRYPFIRWLLSFALFHHSVFKYVCFIVMFLCYD